MKKFWVFYVALCVVGWVRADTTIDPSATTRFYRIQASIPLSE